MHVDELLIIDLDKYFLQMQHIKARPDQCSSQFGNVYRVHRVLRVQYYLL